MLKEYDIQAIANAALMNLSANHSLEIFLEGVNDNTCFSRFVNKKNVNINIAGSKKNAIAAFKIYLTSKKANKKYAISIIDADHDRILKINHGHNEIFLTDDHDLLIQAINTDIALSSILNHQRELCSDIEIQTLRKSLFEKCKTISYLRLINSEEKAEINFKNNIGIISQPNCEKAINYIFTQTPNLAIKKTDLSLKLESKKKKVPNFEKLCQGHDFCSLLSLNLRTNNKNNLSGVNIEKLLMLSYDFRCFKKSNLYKNMKKWGEQNSLKIFSK